MSEFALEFDHVWKKFKKGEIHDSLRDLIPALTKGIFSRNGTGDLEEREFWAVRDVSFQVKRGEALGIIGPNGAGKSTILKLLSKILRPNRGRILTHGRLSALIEVGAGFHPDLTGRENVYLNGSILGMKRQEIARKFDEIVEFAGIGDFIDTPVKRYSSGMYARLGFSVAAHIDPDVLLVDEVLSVGDFPFQTKCFKRMKEVVANGTTVIFISHNIPAVIQLCPQAILLNKGGIQRVGPSDSVCRYYYRAFHEKWAANAQIEIRSVELLSRKDGIARNAFQPGEWVDVRLEFYSRQALEDLCVSLTIKRSDGLMVFGANSLKLADRQFSFVAGRTRQVSVSLRMNLPTGTYFLGANVGRYPLEFFFYDDELLEFHVTGPPTVGAAFVDTEWE